MENFMSYNFNINKIVIASHVLKKGTMPFIQKNRTSHGLALHMEAGTDKIYTFSTGQKLAVKKNDIIFMPKHSDYTVTTTVQGECYAINFDFDENVTFEPFVRRVKNLQIFLDSFKSAEKIWKSKYHGYELKCKAELYNIIFNMQKEWNLGYVSHTNLQIINPALDYIHNNYTTEHISIAQLTELCGISETYLRRLFKKSFGISPVKYINNLKIARAKELIGSGMYSVQEATALSGFYDTSHFCREFKNATGVPPSKFFSEI
ncbi:MAG: helix-turn-helix transcriptional regulator [Clostridia bacterium]|nr:helix-turn-helix transcriptional regulator [Clostridia bacterium]